MITPKKPVPVEEDIASQRLILAERLADLRHQYQWTLEQASAETGLSRAYISKLEKGQMSPTYDSILKICDGYDVDPVELFARSNMQKAPGRVTVNHVGEGETYLSPNFKHLLLATGLSSKAMNPFLSTVRSHSLDDYGEWDQHETEDFFYVLEGEVEVHTEHYPPQKLSKGDSYYMDSRMRHALISTSEQDARLLWVSVK
ncbi:MAG: helix-turn-helix domain-containing protein [Arenicella sp.]